MTLSRRWVVFPRISFFVGFLVVCGSVAACSGESTDPEVVTPEELAVATTPVSSPELLVVAKLLEAANAGDYGEWIRHFSVDAVIPLMTLADVTVQDHFGYETAINTKREAITPCHMASGSVQCTLRIENELFAAAGLVSEIGVTYYLDATNQVVTVNESFDNDIGTFISDFTTWIGEAEPDIYDKIMEAPTAAYLLMTPETADILLGYVDRFVAESPDYPKRQ